ncbi:SPOR domain-containing protein [Alcanivorax marinus]|uniref:SPOR domain-containing protein n=1 Tax=Alloalcanivorax marinus TaxID=1177169 RepID=A0A9Q3UN39_9GAMM|nr:SPOR domain-containing protein [Alloalcanivorax marinus]MCC4308314.1 SPOR domain-containing protein [Alloalcanivorax marinus]
MRDEDFFYEGAERGDLLDALNGHAHESATVVLEGEAGSGVSTLLGMLSMALVGDYELIRLDGAEEPGANAVVDAMLVHFGIERAELADTLKQALAHSRLVVVVDNTESMPEAALATMASLKEKLGQRLAYVFGGAPGSAEAVRAGGLEVVDTLSLPPLDGDDVIALADDFYALSLDREDADEILARSQGRLGTVLHLLDERADEAAPVARKPVPWRHGLAVGALVLVVLVLWLASGDDDTERADKVVNLELPQGPASTVDAAPAETPEQSLAPRTGEDGHDYGLVSDPESSRNALAEFHDNAADFEQAESRRRDEPAVSTAGGAPVPPTEPDAAPARAETPTRPVPAEAPAATPSRDPATPSRPASNADTKAADTADTKTAAADDDRTVPGGQPELSGLDARLGYRQEDWLATRGDDQWFLQLVATGREDGARAVLDQIGREGAYYRTERGGEQVYLVLAGPYSSRDAALKARESLPETLRRGGPFPRDMGAIRKELR